MSKPGSRARKGTGGHGRRALAGKGPTPKAEDRVYHKAYKAKQERLKRAAQQQARKEEGARLRYGGRA